jgi:hypothetical protein
MNNCHKIKDLILTDYIDQELPEDQKNEVSAHLTFCVNCQKFAEETAQTLVVPFSNAPKEQVPEHLWDDIKSKIQEDTAFAPQSNLIERFFLGLKYPKFAPILMSLILLLIIGSLSAHNSQLKQTKDKDQVQYLSALLDSETDTSANNFGTSIEEYFL